MNSAACRCFIGVLTGVYICTRFALAWYNLCCYGFFQMLVFQNSVRMKQGKIEGRFARLD
jgi:hypothetical protein